MADEKTTTTEKAAAKENAEVQAKVDEDLARGYRGSVPDLRSNDEHSLKSGPDSPPLAETLTEARNT